MSPRTTHTYVVMEISKVAFDEIQRKFVEAGYVHVFHEDGKRLLIDMQGIALALETPDHHP